MVWCERLLAAIPNWTSSGHLRGCSNADTLIKSLSSGMYRFYTIVANHNGPLQAMDCPIASVGYDMVLSVARGHPNLQVSDPV
eukprot:scaffold11749_cov94-Skeletonema_marinoi.AAC.1